MAKNIKIKLDFFKRFIKSAICGEDLHGCFMPYGGFAICHLLTDGDDYCKVATLHFEEEFCFLNIMYLYMNETSSFKALRLVTVISITASMPTIFLGL